jgi:hypothetical protein
MFTRITIWFSFTIFSRPDSHSSDPIPLNTAKILQRKKVFYDSLSIVLNKYIVPVGNWGLFKGILKGYKNILGLTGSVLNQTATWLRYQLKIKPL